jgi:DNA-binding MarR family transcriptional regulator
MPAKNHSVPVAEFHLASFLPFRLAVVSDCVARVFSDNYVESSDLTIPEWRALAVIAEHQELSPTAVGHHTAMDKVKVSRAAQSLVTKGLLRQSQDPRDGRGRLLRLTRKGAAIHARIVPLATRLESMLFDELSRADMVALNRALSKISTRLETNGGNGRA